MIKPKLTKLISMSDAAKIAYSLDWYDAKARKAAKEVKRGYEVLGLSIYGAMESAEQEWMESAEQEWQDLKAGMSFRTDPTLQ